MHVEYMVNPMYFASLKFSGIFLVLKAYQVHSMISIMLYTKDIIKANVDTLHVKTAVKAYGYISLMSGRSITNQTIAPISWMDTIAEKKLFILKVNEEIILKKYRNKISEVKSDGLT